MTLNVSIYKLRNELVQFILSIFPTICSTFKIFLLEVLEVPYCD